MARLALMIVLAAACAKEKPAAQAVIEKGFEGIQQAKAIQQQSQKWKAPTIEEAEQAIRVFESGRGAIQTLAVRGMARQDQYDKYVATAILNGQTRMYAIERSPAGPWVASPAGTD
jgi:predicted ATP-dependent protease